MLYSSNGYLTVVGYELSRTLPSQKKGHNNTQLRYSRLPAMSAASATRRPESARAAVPPANLRISSFLVSLVHYISAQVCSS